MKKFYIILILFCSNIFMPNFCEAQAGEWVWLHGSQTAFSNGNLGVKGVPSSSNEPPSCYEPCEWTDLNGNYWIWSGLSSNINIYNDLWKYDPIQNEWTWVSGTNTLNDPGHYGTQGIPSALNRPPARGYGVPTWVDLNGNLWLFGGGQTTGGSLNDLWMYNISTNEWTWMKGPDIAGQPDVYGSLGVPNIANTPGSRSECPTAWTDNAGDLWLFGGLSNGPSYNDLWRYNIATNTWTWMKGPSGTNQPGSYGTQGVEDSTNVPAYRDAYCRWKDNNGNLWFYAGGVATTSIVYDDLWRYNITTGNWTWMSGDSTINVQGIYGAKCASSFLSKPGARFENRAAWTDASGNLWMFGGSQDVGIHNPMNDLWMYCINSNKWSWMSGDTVTNPSGNWGILGVDSPTNIPNGRGGSVGWTDHNGHLYLFGGMSGVTASFITYNDLWKYTIDPCCSSCGSISLAPSFQADTSLCVGDCANFTDLSSNATSWEWSFPGGTPSSASGQNPPSVCYYASGVYDVTLIVSNCIASDTLTKPQYILIHPAPPTPNITQSNDSLFCTTDPSYVSYQWYFNSTPVPGATDTLFTNAQTGDYNVKVVDTNGCSIAVGINIVGMEEFVNSHLLSLFPNPVGTQLKIKIKNIKIETIGIYNVIGELVYNNYPEFFAGEKEINIDVSDLSSSIYFVKLTAEKEQWVGKFVKE